VNEELDPLEAELRNLRPRQPSPDLPRRIGERLASAPAPPVRRTWPWHLALAAGFAAACLVVAVLVWRSGKHDDRPRVEHQGPPLPVAERPEPLPTLGAYRRALDESPEALDALLDEQAARPTDLGLPPDQLQTYLSRSDPFARRGEPR
jgi:hypothetical protein